ncbi:MAG: tyrosine-type recombinase/integrase [Verrucomicrobiota bacterium]
MATVYLRGKIWWARWYVGSSRRHSESTGLTSKREARRKAELMEAEWKEAQSANARAYKRILNRAADDAEAGRLTADRAAQHLLDIRQLADPSFAVLSVRDAFDQWVDAEKSRVSESSASVYEDARRRFFAAFPGATLDAPVGDLTTPQIDTALKAIAATPFRNTGRTISAATANMCLSVLRRVLQSAVVAGQMQTNPAAAVRPLPEDDSTERAPFDLEEVRAMLNHPETSEEWRGMIILGAHTGLRSGDIAGLEPIHLDGSRLLIRPKKTKRKAKKKGKTLVVPLSKEALKWLKSSKAPWFPTISSVAPSTRSSQFRAIMKRAGVPHMVTLPGGIEATRSFHSLRHTFSTWLAEEDIAPDIRQRLTGHASASNHAIYTHHDKSLDRAVKKLPSL